MSWTRLDRSTDQFRCCCVHLIDTIEEVGVRFCNVMYLSEICAWSEGLIWFAYQHTWRCPTRKWGNGNVVFQHIIHHWLQLSTLFPGNLIKPLAKWFSIPHIKWPNSLSRFFSVSEFFRRPCITQLSGAFPAFSSFLLYIWNHWSYRSHHSHRFYVPSTRMREIGFHNNYMT